MNQFVVLNESLFVWLNEMAMSANPVQPISQKMLEEARGVSSLLYEGNPSAKIHIEKITPEFFEPMWSEATSCLILKNNQSYEVGDLINLKEWSCLNKDWKEHDGYSGRGIMRYITHMIYFERDDAFLISLGNGVKSRYVPYNKVNPNPFGTILEFPMG